MDNNSKEIILIIDDDEIQREILSKYFSTLGYAIETSEYGNQGIQKAIQLVPEVILLDIYLPDISGMDVLEEIRNHEELEACVIVMMSSDTSEDTTLLSYIKQADDFVYKPIRTAELAIKLRKLLDRKRYRESMHAMNEKLLAEKAALAHYFPDDVVSRIMASGDKHNLSGENLVATILFFDIRNFTSISEKLKPDLVADLLNLIFTDVMDLILSHDGSINKLIGDAILATFGCPFNTPNDVQNAVKCALAITNTINFFNKVKPKYLDRELKVGIGIATGEVFAGNIGSYRRMEYTVIGDVVNTASRLQSLTKKVDADIIIDGKTRDKAGKSIKVRHVKVKNIRGKSESVRLYTLDGLKEENSTSQENEDMVFF